MNEEGETKAAYRYDAFGLYNYEGEVPSPWLFSGQRYDQPLSCYHFDKREYDPRAGRWLTPDPLGFVDGPNLYAYVNNNPLIYVDPYGLWKFDIGFKGRPRSASQHKRILNDATQCADHYLKKTKRFFKNFREYCEANSEAYERGFIDDATWGASEYALGEHVNHTTSEKFFYTAGTFTSLGVGLLYGNTELKAANYLRKFFQEGKLVYHGGRNLKGAYNTIKHANDLTPGIGTISKVAKNNSIEKNSLKNYGNNLLKPTEFSKISNLESKINDWLGKNTKMIKNNAGDHVFISQDRARKVRFDLNRPAPHSNSHSHVEECINGTWNKSGPIYPRDVPHN